MFVPHIALPTAQKKMAANAHASILSEKIYKMPRPNLPPYSFFAPAPAPERSSGFDRNGIDKSQPSLSQVCNIVLPTHSPSYQHHIANRTAKKRLTPLFGFGLTRPLQIGREVSTGKPP